MNFLNKNNELINDDTKVKLANFLNDYLTSNVWNETLSEYRRNIIPKIVSKQAVCGECIIEYTRMTLPSPTTLYYLYIVPDWTFGGINIDLDTWVPLDTFLSQNKLILNVHGLAGQMYYRNEIFITSSLDNDSVYLAVTASMFKKINSTVPITNKPKDIVVAPYLDSDIKDDMLLSCFCPKSQVEVIDVYNHTIDATTVYLNGREAVIDTAEDIHINDYVEIINDHTVYCTFDIDLQNPDQNRQFDSVKDGVRKQIIHIPKSLNPDDRVITNNTCDVFIRPTDIDNAKLKGLFMHRCQYDIPVSQITHNDFSIPIYVLESYKEYLNTEELTLHVICRCHDKINHLVRNKSYIDLLYTHDDDIILDFLENNKPRPAEHIEFWNAASLEQTEYVKMIEDVPSSITPDIVPKYIDDLGYHNAIALASRSIQRGYITAAMSHKLAVRIPTLFREAEVYVSLFIAGKRLLNSLVTVHSIIDDYVEVDIDNSVVFNVGDEFIIELYEKLPEHTIRLSPIITDKTFTIPYDEFYIAEEHILTTPVKGIDIEKSKSYEEINVAEVADVKIENNIITIIFKDVAFGKDYILQNRDGTYPFIKHILDLSTDKDPIVINLTTVNDNDPNDVYPIFGKIGTIAFLNGLTLVEDVDYKTFDIVDDVTKNLVARQLVISNVSYLNDTNNVIESYITRSFKEGNYHGFLDTAIEELPLNSIIEYYPQISLFSIDGQIIKEVEINNHNINLKDLTLRVGALYGTRTLLSSCAQEYIDLFHSDDDSRRLLILREYFNEIVDTESDNVDFVVIPYSHRLYSLFLSVIFRDVSEGKKKIVFDPDIYNLLSQITEYNYLKKYDIIFTSELDLTYIDLFPTYISYVTPGIENYNALTNIATHELPDDSVIDTKAYWKK